MFLNFLETQRGRLDVTYQMLWFCLFDTQVETYWGFPDGSAVKNLPGMQETQETLVQSLGWQDPLEEGMGTHSRQPILAWRIPWAEEPGGPQSIGLQRISHN